MNDVLISGTSLKVIDKTKFMFIFEMKDSRKAWCDSQQGNKENRK